MAAHGVWSKSKPSDVEWTRIAPLAVEKLLKLEIAKMPIAVAILAV